MADKIKYSQKAIDAALDEIGETVERLSERDEEITDLIAGLATRIQSLEACIKNLTALGDQR